MSSGKRVYQGRIFDVWLEPVDLPNGRRVDLEIIHHPGAAAIVALDPDGGVTLIRQYRHAAGGFIWELPAGKLDPGEAPDVCAARELTEETGLVASDWVLLGSVLMTPGFCDERIHLFLARGLSHADQSLEPDEVLTVTSKPLAEALAMIGSGEIQDAKTIAGLHLASAWLAHH